MKTKYTIRYHGKQVIYKAKELIEKYHYSGTARSQLPIHVFTLHCLESFDIIGVAIFGKPISRHYDNTHLELRRFTLIDDTPKNTESFFLGACIRELKKMGTHDTLITFADPNQGHEGTIYKATNFKFDGESGHRNPTVIRFENKDYHKREVYQKGKTGEYNKKAQVIQTAMKTGQAQVIKQKLKLRYVMKLKA